MADLRFDPDGRCYHVGRDGAPLYPTRYRALSASFARASPSRTASTGASPCSTLRGASSICTVNATPGCLAQTWITVAPVPTTEYARISSALSPTVMEPFMADYNWAILPRHGTVAWADTLWNAFLRVEGLEHYAKIVMSAKAAGPIEPMSSERRIELLTFWGLEHLDCPDEH